MQLADLVARPVGINYIRPQQENKAFEMLKNKFFCAGGRDNVDCGYENVGLKIYPAPEKKGCEVVVVLLQHGTVEAIAAMADRAGMDPPSFAAHVITTMVVDVPTVLLNLLDEES